MPSTNPSPRVSPIEYIISSLMGSTVYVHPRAATDEDMNLDNSRVQYLKSIRSKNHPLSEIPFLLSRLECLLVFFSNF